MTTLPALSTPCTWNTFLARSTPMVLTCMWTTPSRDSLFNNHPLVHSMPEAGVVHPIICVDFGSTPGLPEFRFRALILVRAPHIGTYGTMESIDHTATTDVQ